MTQRVPQHMLTGTLPEACSHKAECQRLARENELLKAAVIDAIDVDTWEKNTYWLEEHAEAIKIAEGS